MEFGQNYVYSTDMFAEEINDRIIKSEDNLRNLAMIGNLFYITDRSNKITDDVVVRIFEDYPDTLGGGLWFKPYIVDKSKKYVCFYAYRDKNNKVVIDFIYDNVFNKQLNDERIKRIYSFIQFYNEIKNK